jgi:hypothetical protein
MLYNSSSDISLLIRTTAALCDNAHNPITSLWNRLHVTPVAAWTHSYPINEQYLTFSVLFFLVTCSSFRIFLSVNTLVACRNTGFNSRHGSVSVFVCTSNSAPKPPTVSFEEYRVSFLRHEKCISPPSRAHSWRNGGMNWIILYLTTIFQ